MKREQWLVSLAAVVIALDAAAIGHTGPGLAAAAEATPRQASWLITLYVFGALLWTPVWARLAAAGRRGATLSRALWVFCLGSVLVASTEALEPVLFGRWLQGAGAGAVMPLASAHLLEHSPAAHRGKALAWLSIAYSLGFLAGVALSSLLLIWSHHWIYLGLALAAAPVAHRIGRAWPAGEPGRRQPFDGVGLALWALLLGSWALGLNRIGHPAGGARWFLGGGALCLLVFLWQQRRQPAPLLPMSALSRRNGQVAAWVALLAGEGQVFAVQLPAMAMSALALTPAMSGPALLPLVIGGFAASVWMARHLDRLGAVPTLRAGGAALLAGGALIAWAPQLPLAFALGTLGVGFGVGVVSGAPGRTLIASAARAEDREAAQAAMAVLTDVGLLLGGSLFGACADQHALPLHGQRFAFLVGTLLCVPAALSTLAIRRGAERRGVEPEAATSDPGLA